MTENAIRRDHTFSADVPVSDGKTTYTAKQSRAAILKYIASENGLRCDYVSFTDEIEMHFYKGTPIINGYRFFDD